MLLCNWSTSETKEDPKAAADKAALEKAVGQYKTAIDELKRYVKQDPTLKQEIEATDDDFEKMGAKAKLALTEIENNPDILSPATMEATANKPEVVQATLDMVLNIIGKYDNPVVKPEDTVKATAKSGAPDWLKKAEASAAAREAEVNLSPSSKFNNALNKAVADVMSFRGVNLRAEDLQTALANAVTAVDLEANEYASVKFPITLDTNGLVFTVNRDAVGNWTAIPNSVNEAARKEYPALASLPATDGQAVPMVRMFDQTAMLASLGNVKADPSLHASDDPLGLHKPSVNGAAVAMDVDTVVGSRKAADAPTAKPAAAPKAAPKAAPSVKPEPARPEGSTPDSVLIARQMPDGGVSYDQVPNRVGVTTVEHVEPTRRAGGQVVPASYEQGK